MGGDERDERDHYLRAISIRTPAWGVTTGGVRLGGNKDFNSHPRVGGDDSVGPDGQYKSFQFAPPRGGWPPSMTLTSGFRNFNSHPRVGGDRLMKQYNIPAEISIRTPAWGVTAGDQQFACELIFQFAPPRGG